MWTKNAAKYPTVYRTAPNTTSYPVKCQCAKVGEPALEYSLPLLELLTFGSHWPTPLWADLVLGHHHKKLHPPLSISPVAKDLGSPEREDWDSGLGVRFPDFTNFQLYHRLQNRDNNLFLLHWVGIKNNKWRLCLQKCFINSKVLCKWMTLSQSALSNTKGTGFQR